MTWHVAHEKMLEAARAIHETAKGQHAKELTRIAQDLRNLAQPIMLEGNEETALRLVDLADAFDGHGGLSRAIVRDELSGFLETGKIHCNTHGESDWIGDIVCAKCLRFYPNVVLEHGFPSGGQCACGEQLLPRGDQPTTARPLCHECAEGKSS